MKILDFRLAKLTQGERAAAAMSALPTTPPKTQAGIVLGTIGYMAPEQVRGVAADHRSDIFAFGAVLYETLSGQRAFRGDTAMDTMMAIAKEDPPDLPAAEHHIPPALVRIVDRCLEKTPAARFQSTRDLAFALEGLSSHSERMEMGAAIAVHARPRRDPVTWAFLGLAALIIAGLSVPAMRHLREGPPPPPREMRVDIETPATLSRRARSLGPFLSPCAGRARGNATGSEHAADKTSSVDGAVARWHASRRPRVR